MFLSGCFLSFINASLQNELRDPGELGLSGGVAIHRPLLWKYGEARGERCSDECWVLQCSPQPIAGFGFSILSSGCALKQRSWEQLQLPLKLVSFLAAWVCEFWRAGPAVMDGSVALLAAPAAGSVWQKRSSL